jgi:oxygen-independent coproporphyrinogen-3 oxidase
MRRFGVNRISINPQTVHDKTLRAIGRAHTNAQFLKAFEAARAAGFDNINVDIIIGLPGEAVGEVARTLETIENLAPDSLTVHTLAIKRGAQLREDMLFGRKSWDVFRDMGDMMQLVRITADRLHMRPYYMYRQKNAAAHFENIGYAKTGKAGVYNVQMMTDRRTILAFGAGGVTKIYTPQDGQVKRIFNVKDVDDYIERLDEMIARKAFLRT